MQFDREKFFKIINLTSSPVDGEALAAVRMANSYLKKSNKGWEDLLLGPTNHQRQKQSTEEPKQYTTNSDIDFINEIIEFLLSQCALSTWEDNFVHSIANHFKIRPRLTTKQFETLKKVFDIYA